MPPWRDLATQVFHDIASGFGLLTRLPAPRNGPHRADAAWTWPLVGLIVGGLAAALGGAAMALGLPPLFAAVVAMGAATIATGGLHEDGLADSADGLFGGWTPERRLEIMKDSHIGSYGTLALMITGLGRAAVLAALLAAGAYGAIIAAAVLSRAPMAVMLAQMPNARGTGLAQSVGRPSVWAGVAAAGLAFVLAVVLTQAAVIMAVGAVLAAGGVAWWAKTKIKGQTGDILGAAQQMSELAALTMATAILAG